MPYLQRRYLVSFEGHRLPHIVTDVLIIGGGIAGLRAALAAAEYGRVIVATKGDFHASNSYYAQGGLAAALDEADTIEAHVADTVATAAGLGDEQVIRRVIGAAPEAIAELRDWGVPFDTNDEAAAAPLRLGREGGHGHARIVHANGDATGEAVTEVLLQRVGGRRDVKLFDRCFVIDLATDPPAGGPDSAVVGALTYHPRYGVQMIWARQTILAAGGAGMLWRETSNPSGATADAIALAFRAGAAVADAEMMQFHPTTLYVAGSTRSLISEAVRGEGARLLDRHGRRFMSDYHDMGELAPRDTVSRAIHRQMAETGSTHVYLDVRHLGAAAFAERFPRIDALCRQFGIDPGNDLIPVHPAAHYMIGGARVDGDGRTSLPGLLACGEAAASGLHGANRLASNSLPEALVFGRRCGELAGQSAGAAGGRPVPADIDWFNNPSERTALDLGDIRSSLRSLMWRNCGIVRRGERLAETREIICFWGRYVLDKEFFDDPDGWQIQNMLTAAFVVSECALRREETRGVHYREDFPETDPGWARHLLVRRSDDRLIVE
ncbi:MAG: L-aspartate oxidase [Phycisphaerae bacterium]|nr:L-aspartate oxidase [Phycisphaerae bacterium]